MNTTNSVFKFKEILPLEKVLNRKEYIGDKEYLDNVKEYGLKKPVDKRTGHSYKNRSSNRQDRILLTK